MLAFERSVRVWWGDCDPARIVFYPRYLCWVDESSHALLEAAGLHHDKLREDYNLRGLVLGEVSAKFIAPGFFGDTLIIASEVAELKRATFKVRHRIRRGEDLLLTVEELRIWAVEDAEHPAGISAQTIPEEVRARLSGEVVAGS